MTNSAIRLLAIAGSERTGSVNRALLTLAVEAAGQLGAEVETLDLRRLALPIYDGDLEDREFPEGAAELRRMMAAHDGLLVASPEYNAGMTPLLKNALDWASRPSPSAEADPFAGKAAFIMSASPSPFGGMRSLQQLRSILSKLGTIVMPQEVMVPSAFAAANVSDLVPAQLLSTACSTLIAQCRAMRMEQTG